MFPELRLVLRDIRRSPGYAACIVLTLGLGVGANTGAFSALDALLLKPLPYPEPTRLFAIHETTANHQPRDVAVANLLDWRARTHLFADMAAYRPRSFGLTLREADPVTVIQTGMVMADFFGVIGVPPALGRVFTEQEEVAEAPLIVLGNRLWKGQFAGDPRVLGRKIWLNEEPRTVIGVMPEGFEYPIGAVLPDAFIPLSRKDYCCGRLGSLAAVARLRSGATQQSAAAELQAVAVALAREYAATNAGRSAEMEPLQNVMTGARREPLGLLVAAAALLLGIALANVSGLLLARSLARAPETAVRIVLGAGIGRLARMYFLEAAVWSATGAACGWLAAGLVLRIVPKLVLNAGQYDALRLNSTAFACAAVLAAVTTLVLGAAPTLFALRADQNSLLQSGSRWAARGSRRRGGLAVVQVALSVVLLLSAALLLRSFLHAVTQNPGFEIAHAWRFGIGLPEKRYDTDQKLIDFHHALLDRLAAIPGVERAGTGPVSGSRQTGVFQIAGAGIPAAQRPRVWISTASPGYFATMGIPLREGREFSWRDDRLDTQRVATVNQAFARAYLHGRAHLGLLVEVWNNFWEIVGVAGDTRQGALDRDSQPEIYLSMSQTGADGAVYVVRTRDEESGMARAIEAAVVQQDPHLENVHPIPLRLAVERSLGGRKFAMQLVAAFGGLALLLTALGIHAIVAFHAQERTREMAIRAALGATPAQIRRLVLRHGASIALAGMALGIPTFFALSPLLRNQLYGVSLEDPLALAAVCLLVTGMAWAASLAPSRSAARPRLTDLR